MHFIWKIQKVRHALHDMFGHHHTLRATKSAESCVGRSIGDHHISNDFDIFEIITIERGYNMSVTYTYGKILRKTNIQIDIS